MALSIDLTTNRDGGPENKIGVFESMLSGVASGLIGIPKGFFSLGASLMDLGVNSGKAAAVEQWFDDLTEFDEKAEATAAGKITEALVNIGIPGGIAFKSASGLAKASMLAGRNNKYVKIGNKSLVGAADEALELTAKGKGRQFIAGALGGGAAEGVFVGDAEKIVQIYALGQQLQAKNSKIDKKRTADRKKLQQDFTTKAKKNTPTTGTSGRIIGKKKPRAKITARKATRSTRKS